MTRYRTKEKNTSCDDCGYVFDNNRKYHSRGRCNPCYQKLYNKGKLPVKATKVLETNCSRCLSEYGSITDAGKVISRGPKSLCKSCYSKEKKPKKECSKCGNMMLAGSNTGLCIICREDNKNTDGKRRYNRKVKEIPFLDNETYEGIRRILVRFKFGTNNLVDNFRVADLYLDVNEEATLLDTLTEEAQVIEMLKNLKKVYEFNKENRELRLEEVRKKADHKKKYYKYKKKEKNLTADMKAYRREYYKKNYANGGYLKALIKRETKN
jgi:hypothetical protein